MALKEVTVISHLDREIKDKHHGIEFVFKPNEKVLIPLAAAIHFFGVGVSKDAPARRAAWMRYGFTDAVKGEAFLKKFECEVVDLVPEDSSAKELKEQHAQTLEELKTEHGKALGDLEAEHREEIQRINKTHAEEIEALKSRIAELEAPAPAGKSHKATK